MVGVVPVVAALTLPLLLSGDTPGDQQAQRDRESQYVIRGGVASVQNLITGSTAVPGTNLTGFSVTTAPGMSYNQLAMVARYPNNQISVTTVAALASIGVPVVPTASDTNKLHATAVVPIPLDPIRAAQISAMFTRHPNPACGTNGG